MNRHRIINKLARNLANRLIRTGLIVLLSSVGVSLLPSVGSGGEPGQHPSTRAAWMAERDEIGSDIIRGVMQRRPQEEMAALYGRWIFKDVLVSISCGGNVQCLQESSRLFSKPVGSFEELTARLLEERGVQLDVRPLFDGRVFSVQPKEEGREP
jgi:hypothetical protein